MGRYEMRPEEGGEGTGRGFESNIWGICRK